MKGEVEDAVTFLPYRGVTIVRSSLFRGDRDEFHLGEEIAKRLTFLFPPKYKPIHARDVATVLVSEARRDVEGTDVVESREIRERAS